MVKHKSEAENNLGFLESSKILKKIFIFQKSHNLKIKGKFALIFEMVIYSKTDNFFGSLGL